jgi:hypothetical protein
MKDGLNRELEPVELDCDLEAFQVTSTADWKVIHGGLECDLETLSIESCSGRKLMSASNHTSSS